MSNQYNKEVTQSSEAVAKVAPHLASSHVGSFLLSLFKTVFLPILPGILLQLAPQLKDPKYQEILKEVDSVLDEVIDETP